MAIRFTESGVLLYHLVGGRGKKYLFLLLPPPPPPPPPPNGKSASSSSASLAQRRDRNTNQKEEEEEEGSREQANFPARGPKTKLRPLWGRGASSYNEQGRTRGSQWTFSLFGRDQKLSGLFLQISGCSSSFPLPNVNEYDDILGSSSSFSSSSSSSSSSSFLPPPPPPLDYTPESPLVEDQKREREKETRWLPIHHVSLTSLLCGCRGGV